MRNKIWFTFLVLSLVSCAPAPDESNVVVNEGNECTIILKPKHPKRSPLPTATPLASPLPSPTPVPDMYSICCPDQECFEVEVPRE